MPVPAHVPPLHEFKVLHITVDGLRAAQYQVAAAYFTEDGAYTLFKDSAHAAVGAFRTDHVLLISRGDAVHG